MNAIAVLIEVHNFINQLLKYYANQIYQLFSMFIQFGNQNLDQTMDTNMADKKEAILQQICLLEKRKQQIADRISLLQRKLDQRIKEQLRINGQRLLQQQGIQNNKTPCSIRTVVRSLLNNQLLKGQQLIRACQYIELRTNRVCMKHNQQQIGICITCKRNICYACSITQCQSHYNYNQQKVHQTLVNQTFQRQTSQIRKQALSNHQLLEKLNKKNEELRQTIQFFFAFLEKQLQSKKLQISQYFDKIIYVRVKTLNFYRQSLKDILDKLAKYKKKEYWPKTIKDLQIFQRNITRDFNFIKYNSQKTGIQKDITHFSFKISNVYNIYEKITKISYCFDLPQINRQRLMESSRSQLR